MKPSPFGARSEAYRKTRAIFVRHWIDLGRLSIHVSSKTIYIHGSLMRLPGVSTQLSPKVVDTIFIDLKRIPGVSRINARFENWEKDGSGTWHPSEKSRADSKIKSIAKAPVHDIGQEDSAPLDTGKGETV